MNPLLTFRKERDINLLTERREGLSSRVRLALSFQRCSPVLISRERREAGRNPYSSTRQCLLQSFWLATCW